VILLAKLRYHPTKCYVSEPRISSIEQQAPSARASSARFDDTRDGDMIAYIMSKGRKKDS
jgi:hypothetical protein